MNRKKGVRTTIATADNIREGDKILLRSKEYTVLKKGSVFDGQLLKECPAVQLKGWIHSPYVLIRNVRKIITQ